MTELILTLLLRLIVVAFLFGWIPVVVYILSGLPMKKERSDITFWAEATAYIILIISLWE